MWCIHTLEYYKVMKMNQKMLAYHTGETRNNVKQIKIDTNRMNKYLLNKYFRQDSDKIRTVLYLCLASFIHRQYKKDYKQDV